MTLNHLRALFPRWDFFDRVAYNFELEVKFAGSPEWQTIVFDQARTRFGLFLNPHCNLKLAQINVLEHFSQDILDLQKKNSLIDAADIQNLTSYRLTKSLVLFKVRESRIDESSIQFKLVAAQRGERIDFYISDWITVNSLDRDTT